MKKNKSFLTISLLIFLTILLVIFFIQNYKLKKEMDSQGRLGNNLDIQRDFELYNALKENNMSLVRKNLELNFMFHLTSIETDGIEYMLDVERIKYICKHYRKNAESFNQEYKTKYPTSIDGLKKYCYE